MMTNQILESHAESLFFGTEKTKKQKTEILFWSGNVRGVQLSHLQVCEKLLNAHAREYKHNICSSTTVKRV